MTPEEWKQAYKDQTPLVVIDGIRWLLTAATPELGSGWTGTARPIRGTVPLEAMTRVVQADISRMRVATAQDLLELGGIGLMKAQELLELAGEL